MAINVTWHNILAMVALAATLFAGLISGTGLMVQWRFDALQRQLDERMNRYERETSLIEKRLDILESRR